MKSFSLFVVALAVTASAVQLPSCATTCVAKAIEKTGCATDNTQCICDSQSYLGYLRHCSAKRCSESDKYAALQSAKDICALVLRADSDLPALDKTLLVQARDTKHEKRQTKEHRAESRERDVDESNGPSWYSPQADQSWYSQIPEPSYYSTVPAASYYTSAPTASYYSAGPAASYYSAGPVASYYSVGPEASYYSAAPTATVI